uniref:Serine proteinase inhibitor n=1 Tax=Rhipicephalus sanguineus TaxID=34632 RepID=C9W1E9_RHISA
MDKRAFVLILVLSNIVPLLAWGSLARVYRRPKTTAKTQQDIQPKAFAARSQYQRGAAKGYKVYQPKCYSRTSGTCIYPLLCLCRPRDELGFHRVTDADKRWYYNNSTGRCEERMAAPNGCNDFHDKEMCERHCYNVTERVRSFWNASYVQAVLRQ